MGIFLIKPGEDPEKATETARRATGISYELYAQNVTVGTPDEIRRAIAEKVDAGINYVICSFPLIAYDHEQLYQFAEEVIPHFQ
jgi:alkanesulfonate monooxygenase SsuD/methylene tetrahydromethanopterin reductase-like flavin-dependent oxidoreductase (luciferase family)